MDDKQLVQHRAFLYAVRKNLIFTEFLCYSDTVILCDFHTKKQLMLEVTGVLTLQEQQIMGKKSEGPSVPVSKKLRFQEIKLT